MQQGHRPRGIPIFLLLGLVLIFVLAAGSSSVFGATGPRTAEGSVSSVPSPGGSRAVVIHELPAFGEELLPAQGAGPSPDSDLTPLTPESQERDPFGSLTGTTTRLAFVSNGVDSDGDGRIDSLLPDDPNFQPNYNIWIMRHDGSEQIQITDLLGDEREPAYDPSSNLFAFASNQTGTWQIYTVEIASGVVRQITTGAGNKRHPTWSPDENWLAFQSDANGQWDIYKIRSDGAGSPLRLTTNPGADTDPCWRPGYNTIAYTAGVGAVTRIYEVDDQGLSINPLSNGGGDPLASDKQPFWQSNGTTLVFASDRFTGAGDTTRNFNIWRMSGTGEVMGPLATLAADASPSDTFDNENPALTTPIARQYMRVAYESPKGDLVAGVNLDIWAHLIQDVLPPRLLEIPSVDNRLPAAGADIKVSVPVYDSGSGVQEVWAFFKDPDRKLYVILDPESYDKPDHEEGVRYLESDCRTVGMIQLDDPDGNGTYEGVFTTSGSPHDYIIDILATDTVGNSLVYDDIYGFSTRIFTPTGRILFVDDYCEGQRFLALLGNNNDYPAGYPVESYYLENPSYHPGDEGTIDYDSVAGGFGIDYDVWRIICRGRIPDSIYQIYLPTVEYQLDPEEAVADPENAAPTRVVPVSQRTIMWAAPHTGDTWVGYASGSIVDATTQADLTNYLNRGGKLFLSGHDIAWALTMNGTVPSSFLNNVLHASFVADTPCAALGYYFSWYVWGFEGYWRIQNTAYGVTMTGQGGDPVAGASWSPQYDSDDDPVALESPRETGDGTDEKHDAAWWSLYPDHIQVLSPATKLYGYATPGNHEYGGPDAGLRYQEPVTSAQLVYLAFGFEQIHRGYHVPSNLPRHCKNHRSHLLTNTYIWMTTGTFQGRVVSIEGGEVITDPHPIVRAIQGGEVKYAVRCQDDGTYVMNGVAPGTYSLEAYRPGYDIDHHYDYETTHAALGAIIVDFILTQSPPGAISGVVTAQATSKFLSNVQVTVYEALEIEPPEPAQAPMETAQVGQYERGAEMGSAVTAADGTYSIGGLPGGSGGAPRYYFVEADGTGIGYGIEEELVEVFSGNNTPVDFALSAAPGTLKATITRTDTGDPLVGAIVQVLQNTTVIKSEVTDANGEVAIDLVPNSYQVRASAAGFGQSTPTGFVIESTETTEVDVTLSPEPPGSLSGRVVSARTGQPIGGVWVHMKVNDVDVVPPVQSSTTFTTPPAGEPYNYKFDEAPTGQVEVEPEAIGYTVQPLSRAVVVATGQETAGVNFQLSSLRTFLSGLQLMSTPYDYEFLWDGTQDLNDPALLLGVDPASLMIAAYQPLAHRYQFYPQAPADHFRLGRGYWLNLAGAVDLSRQGLPASDPHSIRLKTGWNLVGDPFTRAIDLNTAEVIDQYGVSMTLQQAAASGKLQAALFAYVLGGYRIVSVLSPWVGYWMHAGEPVTLKVSEAVGALAEGGPAERWVSLAAPEDGWLLPITVTAGACVDASAYLGESGQATAAYDAALDIAKPPIPDLQPYVYAAFSADQAPGPLAVDLRAPAAQQVWNLTVRTNQIGSQVTVRWPELSQLPAELKPMLEDPATGQKIYMRTSSGYQFTAQEADRVLKISISRSGDESAAVVSALSATAGKAGVSLTYTLGTDAAVSVNIHNISGRLVQRLASSVPQPAGVQVLTWNGKNQAGAVVPAGRYLITVEARTPEGRSAQALTSVWLQR